MAFLGKFYLFLLTFSFLTSGCHLVHKPKPLKEEKKEEKKPTLKSTQNISQTKTPEVKISFIPYRGKYFRAPEPRFSNKQKTIQDLKKRILSLLSKRTGGDKFNCYIKVFFQDWQPQFAEKNYFIIPKVEKGEPVWELHFVTEKLLGTTPPWILYAKALTQVILENHTGEHYRQFPLWLQKGIIYYTLDPLKKAGQENSYTMGQWVTKDAIGKILALYVTRDNVPTEFDVIAKGIINSKNSLIPQVEGYMVLQCLGQNLKDTKTVKILLDEILYQQKNWQESLERATAKPLDALDLNTKIYTVRHLKGNYDRLLLNYHKAVKTYASGDYLGSIFLFDELLNDPKFAPFTGYFYFWTAMAYYKSNRFDQAIKFFAKIFKQPQFFHLFPDAKYRHAMCFYHTQRLQKAITKLTDFQRDYPYHHLCASTFYFLGEVFDKRNEIHWALFWYEKFVKNYPKHHRFPKTLAKAGELSLKMGKYHKSKLYWQQLAQKGGIFQKQNATEKLKQISILEEDGPSLKLRTSLDKLVKKYPKTNIPLQKQLIKELEDIGRITFKPWFEKVINNDNKVILEACIDSISRIKHVSGMPLLIKIMRKEKTLTQKVLLSMVYAGLKATKMKDIIESEIANFSSTQQKEIHKSLERIFWGTSKSLRGKIDNLIIKLNSNEALQQETIEQMTLKAEAQEMIPVLENLALYGYPKSQKKALENLVLFRAKNESLYQTLLNHKENEVRFLALKGLINLQKLPIKKLKKWLEDPSLKVDEKTKILQLVNQIKTPQKQTLIISALEDKEPNIRELAVSMLKKTHTKQVQLELLKALKEDNRPHMFYYNVIRVLEILLGKSLAQDFNSQMTTEQRHQLVQELRKAID